MARQALRSLLFVPGDRPDRFEKALSMDADAVVVEWEDGVRPENKVVARQNTLEFLQQDFGVTASVVRVNSLDSEFAEADLAAVRHWPRLPDFLMMPKVESPKDATHWERVFDKHADANATSALIALVETPLGIHRLWDIAHSSRRLAALSFGPVDLSTALGANPSWESLLLARTSVVMAAAGASMMALDGPCLQLDDDESVRAESRRARELGFNGKLVVHPSQLEAVNEVFTPSADELSHALRLLDIAATQGEGAFRVDGRMVDRPVLERARRVVRLQEQIDAKSTPS